MHTPELNSDGTVTVPEMPGIGWSPTRRRWLRTGSAETRIRVAGAARYALQLVDT